MIYDFVYNGEYFFENSSSLNAFQKSRTMDECKLIALNGRILADRLYTKVAF